MTDLPPDEHLAALLARLREGDLGVRDELVGAISGRLERLAHTLLRGSFGRVGRWADTGDVFQGAAVRLWAALAECRPETPLHFHRLSARLVRYELIDLARHYFGPHGLGAKYETPVSDPASDSTPLPADPAAPHPPSGPAVDPAALHTAVAALPEDEATVTDLLFYQGLNQEAVASHLGVDVRTVQRRWQRARRKLGELLEPDAV
jgi:RNA polymerase sigma factor (sigma-70 family)